MDSTPPTIGPVALAFSDIETSPRLIATVHELYSMVRNNQPWELSESELNDHGQPVIHNIAEKLGCVRTNSDIDLPVHSVYPENEAGMAEMARQLEEQKEQELHKEVKDTNSSAYKPTERASTSELDYSGFGLDYSKAAFGNNNTMALSPQSFAAGNDFGFEAPPHGMDASTMSLPFAVDFHIQLDGLVNEQGAAQRLHNALPTRRQRDTKYKHTEAGTSKIRIWHHQAPRQVVRTPKPQGAWATR